MMETYDEFLVAIDKLACEGKELKHNPKDTPNHDLLYSFFGSYDYLVNKDKAELLVADRLVSNLSSRTN